MNNKKLIQIFSNLKVILKLSEKYDIIQDEFGNNYILEKLTENKQRLSYVICSRLRLFLNGTSHPKEAFIWPDRDIFVLHYNTGNNKLEAVEIENTKNYDNIVEDIQRSTC